MAGQQQGVPIFVAIKRRMEYDRIKTGPVVSFFYTGGYSNEA
jgi:hypothetical protein